MVGLHGVQVMRNAVDKWFVPGNREWEIIADMTNDRLRRVMDGYNYDAPGHIQRTKIVDQMVKAIYDEAALRGMVAPH